MDILIDTLRVTFRVFLGVSGCVGLLALTSPSVFAVAASFGDRTIYHGFQGRFGKRHRIIDDLVLAHSRLFGLLVLATVGYVWIVARYGQGIYAQSLLLFIVGTAMIMGIAGLRQMLRQLRQIELHLREANTDALTGLANRRVFDKELSRQLAKRQIEGTPLCLMTIDIDNFKSFNDRFGHVVGDAILKKVAGVLKSIGGYTDIVARLGGDEFAVLLSGRNLNAACRAADRLQADLRDNPLHHTDDSHLVTVSIGLTEAQLDDDTNSLFKRSDSALYAAKGAGRNCSYRQGGPEPTVVAPEEDECRSSSSIV